MGVGYLYWYMFHLKLKHATVLKKSLLVDFTKNAKNIRNSVVIYMRSQDYTWTTSTNTSIFPPTLIIRVTMTFINITWTVYCTTG